MKNILFLLSFLFFSWLCVAWVSLGPRVDTPLSTLTEAAKKTSQRRSVTFILGEDDSDNNPYFRLATDYYQRHSQDATDTVISNLRSLLDVRNFLESNIPLNGLPWGRINLIVHSNEWIGLHVAVAPGQKRTTVSNLSRAIQDSLFLPLPTSLSDQKTELVFWGCGLGQNEKLLSLLANAFGKAPVYSPKYFVQYRLDEAEFPQRILNKCSFVTFPRGFYPGSIRLSNQFKAKYPAVDLDWRSILENESPGSADQPYYYNYHIPFKWIVTYPVSEDRPLVKTKKQQQEWLDEQAELKSLMVHYNMSKEDFTWTIYPTQYLFEDGVTEPAIKAIGFCTIVCVLDPIGDPESGIGHAFFPLQPDIRNADYFACVGS